MRKMGDINLDQEAILEEKVYDHGLQVGEIMGDIFNWFMTHCPEAFEEYIDGADPEYHFKASRAFLNRMMEEE